MSDYIIAITGGVASGKSSVDRLFHALGIVVADADVAARDAVAPGSSGLAEVVAMFGANRSTAQRMISCGDFFSNSRFNETKSKPGAFISLFYTKKPSIKQAKE